MKALCFARLQRAMKANSYVAAGSSEMACEFQWASLLSQAALARATHVKVGARAGRGAKQALAVSARGGLNHTRGTESCARSIDSLLV
jgi:hypothetical protein